MRALVTGAHGTVGSRLCAFLEQQGVEVVRWDRARVPVTDYWAMEHFVRSVAPDVLFHLAIHSPPPGSASGSPSGDPGDSWRVNYEWTSELAWICRQLEVRFVFTSSVMVFSDRARGPFTLESLPDASEGYGHEKRLAEARVFHQNPEARVARLGWQIDFGFSGNQMGAWLETRAREHGHVTASTRWYPACSFLDDTARALLALVWVEPGLYLLDANTRWSFFEIASALSAWHSGRWRVEPDEHFVFDQRMLEDRLLLPSLQSRLSSLP